MATETCFGLLDDEGAPLQATRVRVAVKAVETVAHVSVVGQFRAAGAVENAKFRAPLDETRSAVTGLKLSTPSRGVVEAGVKAILPTGRSGSRVRFDGGSGGGGRGGGERQRDQFEHSVGKIAEGEEVTVAWSLVMELPVLASNIMVTLPQGVTFPACVAKAVAAAGRAAAGGEPEATASAPGGGEEAKKGDGAEPRVAVCVDFEAATRPESVTCVTHAKTAKVVTAGSGGDKQERKEGDGVVGGGETCGKSTITWSNAATALDGNFVCEFKMPSTWLPAALWEENPEDGTAAMQCPVIPRLGGAAHVAEASDDDDDEDEDGDDDEDGDVPMADVAAKAVEEDGKPRSGITGQVVFVLDRSGSMQVRGKFTAVQTCMAALLKVMPPTVAFNVVSFGSRHSIMFEKCLPATEEHVRDAAGRIEGMSADMGGTNLKRPLQDVFGRLGTEFFTPHVPVQLIVLTDGQVENRYRVLNIIRSYSHLSRCFAFGIGSDVDAELVRGMAFAGKGRSSFVGGSERLLKKAARRLAKALRRGWSEVSIQWGVPDGAAMVQAPARIAPVLDGEFELVYMLAEARRIVVDNRHQVDISYYLDGEAASSHVPIIRLSPEQLPSGTVVKLAARKRIKDFEAGGGSPAHLRSIITPTSLTYGIASRFATFEMGHPRQAVEAPAVGEVLRVAPPVVDDSAPLSERPDLPPIARFASSDSDSDCSSVSSRAMSVSSAASPVGDPGAPAAGAAFGAPAAGAAVGAPAAGTPPPASYAVSYASCSDSSEGEDWAPADAAGHHASTTTRTVGWRQRAHHAAPQQWGAGGRGGGRASPHSFGSYSDSDSDSDSDGSAVLVVRGGAGGAGAGAGAAAASTGGGTRNSGLATTRTALLAVLKEFMASHVDHDDTADWMRTLVSPAVAKTVAKALGLTAESCSTNFLNFWPSSLPGVKPSMDSSVDNRTFMAVGLILAAANACGVADVPEGAKALAHLKQWFQAFMQTLPLGSPLSTFGMQAAARPYTSTTPDLPSLYLGMPVMVKPSGLRSLFASAKPGVVVEVIASSSFDAVRVNVLLASGTVDKQLKLSSLTRITA